MSGELEVLLRLVAEGRISAEEAAPIVAALEENARREAPGGENEGAQRTRGDKPSVQDALSDRKLRVYVAENGHPIVNIAIPLATAGFAIDQVPGLSPDHRSRIVEAIHKGTKGPIVQVDDGGDEVRITIE